jgi:hypothetical protein
MQETTQNTCKIHKFLSYLLVNFDLLNLLHYRMIKLICNRVIHVNLKTVRLYGAHRGGDTKGAVRRPSVCFGWERVVSA